MTMIAYPFLQHRRLASDVMLLEALAGSGACDGALQCDDYPDTTRLAAEREPSERARQFARRRPDHLTKINARTNAEGLPIGLVITPGQAHDVTMSRCHRIPGANAILSSWRQRLRQRSRAPGNKGPRRRLQSCRSAKSANKNEINVAILRRSSF
jgi:hypothetical protein